MSGVVGIPTATHSQAGPGWRLVTPGDPAPPHPHQQFPGRAFPEALAPGGGVGAVGSAFETACRVHFKLHTELKT